MMELIQTLLVFLAGTLAFCFLVRKYFLIKPPIVLLTVHVIKKAIYLPLNFLLPLSKVS
jgi:hypothetical protein